MLAKKAQIVANHSERVSIERFFGGCETIVSCRLKRKKILIEGECIMIIKTTEKTKCDVRDCKNTAHCYVPAKGRVGKFFLCKQCFDALASEVLRTVTPKSPKNTIKKIIDKKAEELYE